ncbi:unnamed protein product [Mytilus coruscus]|uniref:Integrase zinc-binding domain-containing protein n=1 Tax=Mytilus coruscus TaxID=42192 RepID=A0A6J8C191_MYTCO|nr:unnamed protein product [Mytilus coruscus]
MMDHRDRVPYCTLPYFEWRDELSIQEGIIVKREAILIPKSLRHDMKNRLHSAHLGYDSMMKRARRTIFWPGMAKEIKQMTDLSRHSYTEHWSQSDRDDVRKKTRSMIPSINIMRIEPNAKAKELRSARKQSVKKCYDRRAKNLPPLGPGDSVYFGHKQGQHWKLGKVKE